MSEELFQTLQSAGTYREFLAGYYHVMKASNPRFSYGQWSMQCGFKTKSYLRDIITGSKRLAAASVLPVRDSLKVSSAFKDLFLYLVAQEEHDCPVAQDTKSRLNKRVSALQAQIQATQEQNVRVEDELFRNFDWPIVFAGMGTTERGAKLEEIVERANLSESRVLAAISLMVPRGLVEKKGQRFYPTSSAAVLSGLERSAFKDFYIHSLEHTAFQARKSFLKKENLFLSLAFSIDPSKQLELRHRLEQLLHEFSDEAESAEGKKVVRLVCSLN